jgi:hypothetical protein
LEFTSGESTFERRITRPDPHVYISVSRHNADDGASGVSVSFELQKLIWDISAFYFLAVDRRIRSIRIGVRWRRFACGSSPDRIFERVIDNNKRGQFCGSDLDFQQRNIVQSHRRMERC